MIFLKSIDGREMVVNADEIEFIDIGHNSIITMKSGKKILVIESAEEIIKKVISYKKEYYTKEVEIRRTTEE